LLSPVLQKSVCGGFREGVSKCVELVDVDPECFQRVMDLWCGRGVVEFEGVRQLMRTAALAERYQVAEVTAVLHTVCTHFAPNSHLIYTCFTIVLRKVAAALDDAVIEQLGVDTCAGMLEGGAALGLGRAEAAAEGLALARFEEVAATEGFLGLGEESLGRLLDNDALAAPNEERVLERVARWMAARGDGGGGGGAAGGLGLLGKVLPCSPIFHVPPIPRPGCIVTRCAAREGAVRADGGRVPGEGGGEAGPGRAPGVGRGGGEGGAAGEAGPGG
jgi:hypothetical protein